MKKLLLTLLLFAIATFGFAQTVATATDGDYRSRVTGSWSNPNTWQVRSSGTWATATVEPTATNNVFVQHMVTVDAAASCKDLNIRNSLNNSGVTLGVNTLNVSGKLRSFTASAAVTTSDDGALYASPGINAASNTSITSSAATATTPAGVLKFVGDTRTILETGDWASNGGTFDGIVALNPGQTGTWNANIKFRTLVFESGNIVSGGAISVGPYSATSVFQGDVTIKSGAKFTSSRSTLVLVGSSTTLCATVLVESGGILELTGAAPEIACKTFTNNGTVIYSGSTTQEMLKKNATAGAVDLLSYKDLIVSSGTSLTLPASNNITVSGTLTLNSKLAIPSTSTLELTDANISIANGNSLNYIQTLVSGAASGILKVTGLSSLKSFPIGSATNYLPITLSPTSSSNFSINVFNGATTDATPNGTSIADKSDIVDAIYNINRTSGADNCNVTLGWDAGLEGSNFTSLADIQIGAAQYSSGSYGSFDGVGNNTANTVLLSGISTFQQFLVGKNSVLPVSLTSFTAQKQASGIQLKWNTASEQNNSHFDIQRSEDGVIFSNIGKVNGAGNSNRSIDYIFSDKSPLSGTNYYRLSQVDFDGKTTVSNPVSVNMGFSNSSMQVYSSSSSSSLNISISTEKASSGMISIYNLNGQKVFEQAVSVNNGINNFSVSTPSLDKGVFVATYNDGLQVLKSKFVK